MKCCPRLPIAFLFVFIFGAFFYYQYSLTSVFKINFSTDSFYQYKNGALDIFTPNEMEYNLCFYSSFATDSLAFLEKNLKDSTPLLGIDFYQQGDFKNIGENAQKYTELRISSALLLKLIHVFNLQNIPQCFLIKQSEKNNKEYTHIKDFGFYKVVNINQNK